MAGLLDVPDRLIPIQDALLAGLDRVADRFDAQLASDIPPVADLCAHVERYRGKMLRPMLVMLSGLAAKGQELEGSADPSTHVGDAHITLAAVCEMVHMATLVHDDVLDEAATRRRGKTINTLRGNEAAVILGDYLIASAYHLCSQLGSTRPSLAIGEVSMAMCAGELLQLHHREDWSIDEPTYFEILAGKTAALVGVCCELGAFASNASEEQITALRDFGRDVGVAFQIQDDVLDLTGREEKVGKSVGKDLEKGKLTLPVIRYLDSCDAKARIEAIDVIRRAAKEGSEDDRRSLATAIESSGSLDSARQTAHDLVATACARLDVLDDNPAVETLRLLARMAVERAV